MAVISDDQRAMKRIVWKSIAFASIAGLVAAPAVLVLVQVAIGRDISWDETLIGGAVGTVFMAFTAIIAAIYQDGDGLTAAVMTSYILKTTTLVALGFTIDPTGIDTQILAAAIGLSALSYIVTQSVLIARQQRSLSVSGVSPEGPS